MQKIVIFAKKLHRVCSAGFEIMTKVSFGGVHTSNAEPLALLERHLYNPVEYPR